MSFVVLLFGASGSGKSLLMSELVSAGKQYSIHIKGTDRPAREYDGIEIRCVPTVTPDEYDYIYQTYGFSYGIQRRQIEEALSANRYHFIICNDIPTIRAIKRDFDPRVRVVFHHFDAPREAILAIQAARKISDDEVDLRIAKIEGLYRSFVEDRVLFDGVLHNHFGDPPGRTREKMESLLSEMARPKAEAEILADIDRFVRKTEEYLRTLRPLPASTVQPGYIFIVMAMTEGDAGLEESHEMIKRTCASRGFRAERVDDISFTGQITEKIMSNIQLCEVVVADLSRERPNVYYEVGYASALRKEVILLARKRSRVHFDLQGNNILFYKNMIHLEELLGKMLDAFKSRHANVTP